MKRLIAPLAVVTLAIAARGQAAEPVFEPARLAGHIAFLASDALEGRGPATRSEPRVVAYVAGQLKAAGLKPGGDRMKSGARAWTQSVPLASFAITGPVAVSVTAGGRTEIWDQGEQVALRAAQTGVPRLTIRDAPLVFLGYGVRAPERSWDDFKGVDLKGKVGLVLVNDPDFETGEGDFGGRAMTYYGRWTYKYEEAARQGALGLLVIHEAAAASYGWATVNNSNTIPVFDIIRADPARAHPPLEGWIQRDAAVDLFREAGLDFEELKRQARSRSFRPTALPGVTFSTDFAVEVRKVVSSSIVGVAPGAARPGERVIYTAHWDHLGVGPPDADGDRIYNGAVDNASGVAELIELARAFGRAPKTQRSVVFLAVAAEEKGLLGSEYYAAKPLYPLATTVGVINMDGAAVNGPARDISTAGEAPLTLQDDLIAVARAHGRHFSPDPRPEAGSFFRSDHFPFAKRGVPAISFKSGEDLVKGGRAAGRRASEAYNRDRYHQPADEYDPEWDLTGMSADLEILYDLGRRLANSRGWPQWKTGAEFKAVRDATRTQRR